MQGGAFYFAGGTVTATACFFADNVASTGKGMIAYMSSTDGSQGIFTECTFSSNTAGGSALYNEGPATQLVVTNPGGVDQTTGLESEQQWSGGIVGQFSQCAKGYYVSDYSMWSPSNGSACTRPSGCGSIDGNNPDYTKCYPCDSPICEADCTLAWAICDVCGVGEYTSAPFQAVCTGCPAGRYNTRDASDSSDHNALHDCLPCPRGNYSTSVGAASCMNCPAGFYTLGGNQTCVRCPAGYACDGNGDSLPCPPGTYSQAGASDCSSCDRGKFTAEQGEASCDNCPAGTFSRRCSITCTDCDAGTYSALASPNCSSCEDGQYSNQRRQSMCGSCDLTFGPRYTSNVAHTDCSRCVADYVKEDNGTCVVCPNGATCKDIGTNSTNLGIQAGHYRFRTSTLRVRACPYGATACVGGSGVTNDDCCAEGYESALCAACSPSYFLLVDTCKPCSLDGWSTVGWAMFAVLFVAVLVFALRWSTTIRGLHTYVWSSLGCQLKTIWSGVQIMSAFPSLLFTLLPTSLQHFYSALEITNFNPTSAFALACVQHNLGTFFAELISTTALPIAVALAIWAAWLMRTRALKHDRAQCFVQHLRLFLLLCYLTLPSVTTVVFSAFDCDDDFGVPDVAFLRADYGTSCHSDVYRFQIVPWAIACVVIYPVGMTAMYAIVLYLNRDAIQKGDATDIAFLHYSYKPSMWFWEPVDLLRRVSLTGLLALFHSDTTRVATAVLVSFFWLLVYQRVAPFEFEDDQMLASIVNAEIVFTTILLAFHDGLLIDPSALGVLCIGVNLVLLPIFVAFQARHAWRGAQLVTSLEPGSKIGESFDRKAFARCWAAGGDARDLTRRRTLAWLDQALQSLTEDGSVLESILRVVRLPPFQIIDSVGEDSMGVVLKLEEEGTPSFALVKPLDERGGLSAYDRGPVSSTAQQPLLPIHDATQQAAPNSRLLFINSGKADIDVLHTAGEFAFVMQQEGESRIVFESVLLYSLQRLVEEGYARTLLNDESDAKRDGWYPVNYLVHFLAQSQLMMPPLLSRLINEVGASAALLRPDDADRHAFHYLKFRRTSDEAIVARGDDAIADLIVSVAESDPSLVQVLLQQATAHAFVAASRRLIKEHGGQIDQPSEFDAQTPREVAKMAGNPATRALFDTVLKQTRRDLFRCSVLSQHPVVEPWSLAKGELQEWLRARASESSSMKSLQALIDLMEDVEGLTILDEWVDIGFHGAGTPQVGKLNVGRVKHTVKREFKPVAVTGGLSMLLGVVHQGKQVMAGVHAAGSLSFYKALLLSCEKRSLLTDYAWVKMVGEGAFGRAHLCRYGVTDDGLFLSSR